MSGVDKPEGQERSIYDKDEGQLRSESKMALNNTHQLLLMAHHSSRVIHIWLQKGLIKANSSEGCVESVA